MCHRRGEWSRTTGSVTESEDEREREESVGWGVRAKERLASLLPVGEDDTADRTPDGPAVASDPETPTADPERGATEAAEDPDTEDEREEEPIPADD